jgi:hypothetical protein
MKLMIDSTKHFCPSLFAVALLVCRMVQTGDIVNTSPGTSFTPGGCPGWKRMS